MRTRNKMVGAASAALISAAMLVAPVGASAATPTPDPGSTAPDPNGPFAPDRDVVPGPLGAGAEKKAADETPLYEPAAEPGFHPTDSTASSTDATEKLGAGDVKLLQKAQADETDTVTVMVLARKGATEDVVKAVRDVGGTVGSVTESVGYVRATVPTETVPELAGMSSVKAIDLNRTYPVPVPDLGTAGIETRSARSAGPSAPDAGTPAVNPYMPISETGATDFVDANPAWDGRGTVVGVLDTGVDVGHPALQTTSDGKQKIVDWFTATDPVQDGDPTWVRMTTARSGPSFNWGGMTWTAPAGDFLVGSFYEYYTLYSDFAGDLNGNGDVFDRYAVLYEPSTHKIWVDADGDQNFVEEPAMSPYGVDQQISHFGTDDPATPANEQIPFVVEYRDGVDLSPLGGSYVGQTASYVNIGLPAASHGTHVAGIVAATSMFGGEMHGAAPGAQIVSARACTFEGGCTSAALTEGMIDLVTNRHVDVVNLSIGGLPPMNDGSDVIAALYDQLIDAYGVQIIISAGNDGLGTNTVSAPSVAGKAISVAASVSSDTWWANYGSEVSVDEGIFGFSSRGPAENGALAPQVAAPGAAVSSIPMWLDGDAVPETGYALPAGYGMANGTSMAAPQVAGAAALLLSAAKAESVEVTPAALKTALIGTARQLPGVPTTAQGAGIVDTVAAWKQLGKTVAVNALSVTAPVCTSLSDMLATPDTGVGVYNRCLPTDGGQVTGEEKTYKVGITRTSGASGKVNHRIGWIGNDGTFSARAALPLRKDKAADITVTATAAESGLHSAIMTIDDPATVGIDQFVPVTVLATAPLAEPDYAVTTSGTLPRSGSTSVFVPVPEGVEALQLTLGGLADGSQVRVLPIDPDGMPADSNASNHCYTGYADPAACNATARPVYRPKAGIWEFVIEARRTSPTDVNTFTASVALQGMSFEPSATTIDSVTLNAPTDIAASGKNAWGAVSAHVASGEIGTVTNLYSTVSQGEITQNQLYVPRETTRLDVTLTPREPADLDFYVYFGGMPVGQSTASGDGPERIIVDDPQPGTYYIVVAGVTGQDITFDYHQEMFSKGQGTIAPSSDATHELATGESMPVDGAVKVSARQLTSEPLVGRMRVANEYGTIIGAVDVEIAAVEVPQLDIISWAAPWVGSSMNDSGVVAGDRQINGMMSPTTWSVENGFKDLENTSEGYGSSLGINADGTAVGVVTSPETGGFVPAQWATDGALTVLGSPDWRAYTSGYATGINDAGFVTGFAELTIREDDGLWHNYSDGYVRSPEGVYSPLQHLSPDVPEGTQPRAINADGIVVGNSLTAEYEPHAVMWDASTGVVRDLGTLPGQWSAQAMDVSATGKVVGISGDDAFVWTEESGMTRLADYGYNATAEKVTDDGWILGTVELSPDDAVSAMWDPQGNLWDLSGMVPVAEGSWFYPTYSFDINNEHELMIYGQGGSGGEWSSTVMLSIPADLRK